MTLSYRSYTLDGLYVIVWGATPDIEDVGAYVAEIERAARIQGEKIMGLGIVPEHSATPSEAFRSVQAAALPEIVRHLYAGAIVFEGTSVAASLKRTAFSIMTLVARIPCPVYVRSSVEDALLTRPPRRLRFDAREAIARLRAMGVV